MLTYSQLCFESNLEHGGRGGSPREADSSRGRRFFNSRSKIYQVGRGTWKFLFTRFSFTLKSRYVINRLARFDLDFSLRMKDLGNLTLSQLLCRCRFAGSLFFVFGLRNIRILVYRKYFAIFVVKPVVRGLVYSEWLHFLSREY